MIVVPTHLNAETQGRCQSVTTLCNNHDDYDDAPLNARAVPKQLQPGFGPILQCSNVRVITQEPPRKIEKRTGTDR